MPGANETTEQWSAEARFAAIVETTTLSEAEIVEGKHLTRGYNEKHRHSGIRFVTPAEWHRGDDGELTKRCDELYSQAQKAHPEHWLGRTRN
ncbi:MAG: hypothetical protein XXXJIFNMEKO3_02020 [Candidatus Erwinia impunctatus]